MSLPNQQMYENYFASKNRFVVTLTNMWRGWEPDKDVVVWADTMDEAVAAALKSVEKPSEWREKSVTLLEAAKK